jgi:O-antigen/teichoic acid export membrane protein
MVVWAGFLSLLDSERAVGRSLGMFAGDSIVNSLESVGRVLAVGAAWALGLGLAGYAGAFALECAVAAVAFYAVLSRRVRLAPPRLSLSGSLRFLRASLPLGLTGIAFVGFYQVDQVFVRALAGAEANGLYAAATRVVFAANTLGSLVVMAAYPDLARLRDDVAGFRQRCAQMLGLAAGIGAAVAAVTVLLAGPIVAILYGPGFAGTEPLLRVLAPIVLMDAVVVGAVYAGNALGRERRVLAVVAAMFAVNILANAVLVPVFGALAAAWVSTLGEVALAAALLAVCWDRLVLPAPRLEADAC